MTAFSSIALALALTLGAGDAFAQGNAGAAPVGAAPDFSLPRAYDGYSQPEITQCATKDAGRRDCVAPAMTAGRYLILAAANASATGASATQALAIVIGGKPCFATRPVPFTGDKGVRGACEAIILTDRPLTITAAYRVQSGTPVPAGPQLVVRRLPWDGVIAAGPVALPPPAAAGAAPKK